jgi:alpha-1,3-mannosyl-glycoprotein beta-1,2-N-acetylglucosaminyltransferase
LVVAITENSTTYVVQTSSKVGDSGGSLEEATAAVPVDAEHARLGLDTVLLIICANRPEYLQQTLERVVKYHPEGELPIFVSQDGNDMRVDKLIKGTFLHLKGANPDLEFVHKRFPAGDEFFENGYFRLAAHYKWALNQVFQNPSTKRVIILEEDLLIAEDFFELFAATKSLLDEDKSLLAVSAWNDNGMQSAVKDSQQLYRSDFFPGLGWMLPRRVWQELGPRWPRAYWDDWLREPKQRQGRHIIRPEVCRTFHIGQHGVSNAQYSSYLNSIKLNDKFVPFTTMDLSHLQLEAWDKTYLSQVRVAQSITFDEARSGRGLFAAKKAGHEVRITYDQFEGGGASFSRAAAWSGAMDNVKAGVPRTAYKGIVSLWKENIKIHIVPASFK